MKRRSHSRLYFGLIVASLVAGCGDGEEARQEEARRELAQADAERLGAELFDLVDQTVAYQTSRARGPRHLREVGIDSLTRETARWVSSRGGTATVTVAFRRLAGHALSQCSGTSLVLEEQALEGLFRLECQRVDGGMERYAVGTAP